MRCVMKGTLGLALPMVVGWLAAGVAIAEEPIPGQFLADHCYDCHSNDIQEGGLNLESLTNDLNAPATYATWVRVHDRIHTGEMPPATQPRPKPAEAAAFTGQLDQQLLAAGRQQQEENGRAPLRRLTRTEYENTVGDLLAIEGAPLKQTLPADGTAHDTEKHADALDLSYVQIRQYMAAADHAMDLAIVTFPTAPDVKVHRAYPQRYYRMDQLRRGMTHLITADRQRDPRVPLANKPIDKPVINALNLRDEATEANRSLGILLNENQIWKFGASLAGKYRVRGSFWSFNYNQGKIEPTDHPQAAALLVENQRGESVLRYADAPSMKSNQTELVTRLNPEDRIGWKATLVFPVRRDLAGIKDRAAGYQGSGVAVDWIELEGPLFDQWPPESHRHLFGDLPLEQLSVESDLRLPQRTRYHGGRFFHPQLPTFNVPFRDGTRDEPLWAVEQNHGPFTPTTYTPSEDAQRLLGNFLPRAFRRPVEESELAKYVAIVEARMAEGDCFENAMRMAYQAALSSYSFLYRVEQPGPLDDHALATRLSYFLWDSMPDAQLRQLANRGKLNHPEELKRQVDRMLASDKFDRFLADFLDQWLNLNEIEATTPDDKLYPEFQPFMADMMVAETRAYFGEMIRQNRPAWEVVDSDWAMLNHGVAALYDIDGVEGAACRRVELPDDSQRGGLITQASVLKVTADGTSTSPVRRGVFLLEKILGTTPAPPPPDIGNVDPDVRGATTIRELLAKHRDHASCAACHTSIDPPGFALESFDPVGRYRQRYRGTEIGDDPAIRYANSYHADWLLGPPVDSSGVTEAGESFQDIDGFRQALSTPAIKRQVARNLLERMVIYATGSEIQYTDRPEIRRMMQQWGENDYRMGELIHLVVQSDLFGSK